MFWLVDGYNVALSDAKLSRMLRNDNEAGRRELLVEIAGSRRFSRQNITIVFDGRFAASSARETPRLLVKFTDRGETADDLIKREIGESVRRRALTVVTDDRSILAYARECGAKTLGSTEFLSMVRGKVPAGKNAETLSEKPEPAGRPDPDLLKMFTGKKR